MKVKCLKDVYSIENELLFKKGNVYPTSVYKCMLSAQTESGRPYPLGYEVIAYDYNENWYNDEWFRERFEIVE